jgi:hypothetical protein
LILYIDALSSSLHYIEKDYEVVREEELDASDPGEMH